MSFDIRILGHICSAIACAIMIGIGFLKKKNQLVVGQCFQLIFFGGGNFLLGATSGGISNALAIVRNVVLTNTKKAGVWKIIFILAQLALTLLFWEDTMKLFMEPSCFMTLKWIDWIPLVYAIMLTLVMDCKRVNALRIVIILGQSMFCLFDGYYRNYFAIIANVLTVITNSYSIFMSVKEKGKEKAA